MVARTMVRMAGPGSHPDRVDGDLVLSGLEICRLQYSLCTEFEGHAAAQLIKTHGSELASGECDSTHIKNIRGPRGTAYGLQGVTEILEVMRAVHSDMVELERTVGHRGAGDSMAGWLAHGSPLYNACDNVRHLITGLGEKPANALRALNRDRRILKRLMGQVTHQASVWRRAIIDRTKRVVAQRRFAGWTFEKIEFWIKAAEAAGADPQHAEAIGWQACAESGYTITCDTATSGLLAAFSQGAGSGHVDNCVVRGRRWGNRSLRMSLFPLLDVDTGARLDATRRYRVGRPLSRREASVHAVSGTDLATGDYSQARVTVIRWYDVAYSDRIGVPELCAVESMLAGDDEWLARLYVGLKLNAVRCRLPEGIENGKELERALQGWKVKQNVKRLVRFPNVNLRAVVGYYSHSEGYIDFCRRLGRRLLSLHKLDTTRVIDAEGRVLGSLGLRRDLECGSPLGTVFDTFAPRTRAVLHSMLLDEGLSNFSSDGEQTRSTLVWRGQWEVDTHQEYARECVYRPPGPQTDARVAVG